MTTILGYVGGVGFQELIALLFALAITVIIFLALRAFFLWYWKISTIISNQEKQNKLLTDLMESLNQRKPNAS